MLYEKFGYLLIEEMVHPVVLVVFSAVPAA